MNFKCRNLISFLLPICLSVQITISPIIIEAETEQEFKTGSFELQTDGIQSSQYNTRLFYIDDNGNYNIVENITSNIGISSYKMDALVFQCFDKTGTRFKQKEIERELPSVNKLYHGKNNNYCVFAKGNSTESDSEEVLRIVKYDQDWNRISSCSIYGENTQYTCFAGTVGEPTSLMDIDESNGLLVIHTCHTMYKISDGLNHQANMTFVISEDTMSVLQKNTGISTIATGYVSHSFDQYVKTEGNSVFRIDRGDAHPRAIVITKSDISNIKKCSYNEILRFGGQEGDNKTGASLNGFELAENNCIALGTSINQSVVPWTGDGQRNIFVTVINKQNLSYTTKWITSYSESDKKTIESLQLIKVNNNKFVLMWEERADDIGKYTKIMTIDGSGNITKNPEIIMAPIYQHKSSSKPVIDVNGNITWAFTDYFHPVIYSVDLNDLQYFQTKTDWKYDESTATLTISGIGKMPYYSTNPPYSSFKSKAEKIIIESGITSISREAFCFMSPSNHSTLQVSLPDTLEEIQARAFHGLYRLNKITIPNRVTTIGDHAFHFNSDLSSVNLGSSVRTIGLGAFYGCAISSITFPESVTHIGQSAFDSCENLSKVTIPPSVTSIGTNAFARCSSNLEISGYTGSCAETYALENNISFHSLGEITTAITTVISSTSTTNETEKTEPSPIKPKSLDEIYGDLNQDGEFSVSDISNISRIKSKGTSDAFDFVSSDVNADGIISDDDSTEMYNIIKNSRSDMSREECLPHLSNWLYLYSKLDTEKMLNHELAIIGSGSCGKTDDDQVEWHLFGDGTLLIGGKGEMSDLTDIPLANYNLDINKVIIADGITNSSEVTTPITTSPNTTTTTTTTTISTTTAASTTTTTSMSTTTHAPTAIITTATVLNTVLGTTTTLTAYHSTQTTPRTTNASISLQDGLRKFDINKDNRVTIADAVLLTRFVSEDEAAVLPGNSEPDVDADGLVTIEDVMSVLRALQPFSIQIGKATAKPGEKVTVPIKIYADKGTAAGQIYVGCDSKLTPVSVKSGDAYTMNFYADCESYPITITWTAKGGKDQIAKNGSILAELEFEVDPNIKSPEYLEISIMPQAGSYTTNFSDSSGITYTAGYRSGYITVIP